MTRTRRIATIAVLGTIGAFAGMTVAAAGGGGHCDASEDGGGRVELEGACFTPSTLWAEAGQTITFLNRDPFAHNVSGSGWGHYEDLDRGDRYTTSFADEGIYPFACTLHPGMNGVIVVGDAPAADATVGDATLVAASTAPPSQGGGWVAAGIVGVVIGAAAGAGLTMVRRRAAAS